MVSEDCVIFDSDNVISIFRVVFLQVIKDLKFNTSLIMESLFVSYDFDSYKLACFIIITLQSLTKATFS